MRGRSALALIAGGLVAGCVASAPSVSHLEGSANPSLVCPVRVLHGQNPLRDARLWLVAEMDPVHRGPRVPTTDADGRARLEVRTGERLFPYLELGGEEGMRNMALASIEPAAVEEGCRDELDIELPATTVRVEVRDATSGATVPGAFVGVAPVESQAPRGRRRGVRAVKGATGPTGVISIPGLAAGGWMLTASTNRGAKRASRTIELREGETVEVQLVVETPARLRREL